MEPADFVLRFLESSASRAEAEFYLGLFRALPKERFAAISVDASVARYALEAVVLDLRFLAALGLCPVVVLGLFDDAEAIEHASRIRRRLEREGVRSIQIASDAPDLDRQVKAAATSGGIPLIAFPRHEGGHEGGLATAVELRIQRRVDRLGALLAALATRKMIFLDRRGGLSHRGARVEVANLTTDEAQLLASRDLSRKQKMLVVQSRRLVFELSPHRLLVAITSPLDLLRELFSTKGAGTLLRRGATIVRHEGMDGVDPGRLRALIERSFGRPATEAFFDRPALRVYREEGYRGAAVISESPLGPYLTKFAVEREAQGEGIGRDLWDVMAADLSTLFWRARAGNPIAPWYTRLCHGLQRSSDWTVYWRGLPPVDIPRAIEWSLAQPIDIAPPPPPSD